MATPASALGLYVPLTSFGPIVQTPCNPIDSPLILSCKVLTLPGEIGYTQVASRTAPILINGVTIGTQYEIVWRSSFDPSLYIFGLRVMVNASPYDGSGASFNVNDIQRQVRTDQAVSIAYQVGSPAATKALQYAGRTFDGLGEYDGFQPDRNNGWVDFRIDTNAADPDGASSPYSPWLLTKTRAPEGYSLQPFALRILNSDFDDVTDEIGIFASAYQPICTSSSCKPTAGDDD